MTRGARAVRRGVLAAAVGLLLTAVLGVNLAAAQRADTMRELERTAGVVDGQITRRVAVVEAALLSLTAQLGVGDPAPAQFQSVLRRTGVVEEVPGLLALVWAEQALGDEEVVAPVAVHPLAPNTEILGRNLLDDPVRRRAIEVARDEARTTATTVVTHVDGGVDAILVMAPVHRITPDTVVGRRLLFRGVVMAVVSPAALLQDVEGMPVCAQVRDLGAVGPVAAADGPGGATTDGTAADVRVAEDGGAVLWATEPPPTGDVLRTSVQLADRRWELAMAPGEGFPVASRDVPVAVVAGVLLSLLLGVVVWSLADRRRRLEELVEVRTAELQRTNEELEVASRLQTQFISTISHELRTPLTSVIGFVQTLRRMPDTGPAERDEFLGRVERNAQTLRRMIEDLLDFGRLQRGEQPLQARSLDVGSAVVEIVRDLQPTLAGRRVLLRVERGAVAEVDRSALEHVVRNLVSNALRYAPDAGPVEIGVRRVDDLIVLRCRDRGPGFEPDDLPVLCERFVRGSGVMGDGTGIGLALVRELAAAHGGAVRLANRDGGGAEVAVSLPAAPAPVSDRQQRTLATVVRVG